MQRQPTIQGFSPAWWHHHGTKMKLVDLGKKIKIIGFKIKRLKFLSLKGSAASLTITQVPSGGWYVDWEVIHSRTSKVNGRTYMDDSNLENAFGLEDKNGRFNIRLRDKPEKFQVFLILKILGKSTVLAVFDKNLNRTSVYIHNN